MAALVARSVVARRSLEKAGGILNWGQEGPSLGFRDGCSRGRRGHGPDQALQYPRDRSGRLVLHCAPRPGRRSAGPERGRQDDDVAGSPRSRPTDERDDGDLRRNHQTRHCRALEGRCARRGPWFRPPPVRQAQPRALLASGRERVVGGTSRAVAGDLRSRPGG